jgi:hypothetical protein
MKTFVVQVNQARMRTLTCSGTDFTRSLGCVPGVLLSRGNSGQTFEQKASKETKKDTSFRPFVAFVTFCSNPCLLTDLVTVARRVIEGENEIIGRVGEGSPLLSRKQ